MAIGVTEAIEVIEVTEANDCRVVSLRYPGVLELWHQHHMTSHSDRANLSFPFSSVRSTSEIVVLIRKNVLDTGLLGAVTLVSTGLEEPSQECSELATTFNLLLYRSVDNAFTHLNLFVHNTGEIYSNVVLGIIRHIRLYRSRVAARIRRTEPILPPAVCSRRTVVNDVDRKNHGAFKDDDSSFSSFRSRIAGRHRAWQHVRNNFGFANSNVSSQLS